MLPFCLLERKKMRLVFDIEASGLLNDETIDYTASPYVLKDHYKFHCLVIKNIDTGEVLEYDPDTFKNGVEYIKTNATTLIGHNIVDYDLLALKLGFDFDYTIYPDTICGRPCTIIDTLVLSKTLNADRLAHSLDYLGKLAGVDKIDWRGKAIDLGLIDNHAPKGEEFKAYHPAMLEYNRQDVEVNHKVFDVLMKEWGTWNWQPAFELEMAVRDIVTRQSHRGFYFDVEKAKENVRELDILMQQAREIVEPLLPPCKLSMARASETTPPKIQFKKDGTISANMVKFAEKMGAVIEDKMFKWGGKDHQIPMPLTPLIDSEPASIEDTTHIKGWLVDLGWWPTVYKERDLTVDSKKKKLTKEKYKDAVERYMTQTMESPFKRDRMFHLTLGMKCKDEQVLSKLLSHDLERPMKVYTNPTFTVGQDKELCPKLEEMSEIFPHVYKVVEFLTYRHRRNSILGGGVGIDEDDIEMEKGYLANIRADGRIPTPADTCGCNTSRFKHRIVTNIPRTTSMYGKNMRAMFGVERKKYAQFGYDFSSLEGRMESHYCVPMDTKILTKTGWKDYYGLQNGELVLGYNSQTGEKEWTKVTGKVFYEDAETVAVSMGRQKFTTTQDHRWYVEQRCTQSKTYIPKVITTRELNTGTKVITNAPFNTTQDLSNACDDISQGKYNVDWVKRVLDMSHNERIAFMEGFMVADGYYHEHKQRPVWRWAQNGGDIFEAALLATYLVHDGNVTVANNDNKAKVKVVTLCRNGRITGQSMKKTDAGIQDVWCPQTELGSWVMRQGDCITITGNCWKYDETKEYCNSLVLEKPFDVHTLTAKKISEILGKPFGRSPAKSTKYCCTYGGRPMRVAMTIGSDFTTGKQVYDAFWLAADPLRQLGESLKKYWETMGGKKFVLGIDGRKVPTRSASALVNSLLQSAGVICAKWTMVLHDRKLAAKGLTVDFFRDNWKNKSYINQMVAMHDEAQMEVSKGLIEWKIFKEEDEAIAFKKSSSDNWSEVGHIGGKWFVGKSVISDLLLEAVDETTAKLKLNIPLGVEFIYGDSWATCH